jgi:hypothetical protein
MTLIVTNLIVLRTATTNFVVLYIPLFFALKVATDRLPGRHGLLASFYILSTIGLWVLFIKTVAFVWARTALQESPTRAGDRAIAAR